MSKINEKCKNCGHYSIIIDDDKNIIEGCTGTFLIMEEYLKEVAIASFDKKMFKFEAIDSTFRLNENNDCFLWIEQSDGYKDKVSKIKNKKLLKRIFNF